MPITRTPIIDDSGAGTDGTVIDNAWKQQFYDQIDALFGGFSQYGGFNLTDVSGAGLALVGYSGAYQRVGRFMYIQAQVIYPTTANGANASLGGLPAPAVAVPAHGGLFQGYGALQVRFWVPASGVTIGILHATNGVPVTNAQLSGANITMHGFYLVD